MFPELGIDDFDDLPENKVQETAVADNSDVNDIVDKQVTKRNIKY